jgi:hypothetical protein
MVGGQELAEEVVRGGQFVYVFTLARSCRGES